VGDLVDRGPENIECLRLLKEPWVLAVPGNHEQMMCEYFKFGSRTVYGSAWGHNGGTWGQIYARKQHDSVLSDEQQTLADEMDELVALAEKLPLIITVTNSTGRKFHVLHAELRPSDTKLVIADRMIEDPETVESLFSASSRDGRAITWGRFVFGSLHSTVLDQRTLDKFRRMVTTHYPTTLLPFGDELSTIYSGHTIVRQPVRVRSLVNLDTGAYQSYNRPLGYGGHQSAVEWAGLTMTEPATGQFWIAKESGVEEVECLTIL
jgi:serine/threonine protein phosphatase 1